MVTMYDSANANGIPKDAKAVAGYINGKFAWSKADWARFPNATKVRIQIYIPGRGVTNAGDVLDIEAPDANSPAAQAAAVKWVKARKAAGLNPTIYTSKSTRAPIDRALKRAGLSAQWWIADVTNKPHQVPGAVATQYLFKGNSYDKSEAKKSWLDKIGRRSGGGSGGGGGGDRRKPRRKGDGKPGDVRTAWRLPRGVAGKGGKILIDTGHLLQLSRNLTGHLATVESVRRNANACEERVARLRLTDQDQLPRIRKNLATAISDEYGVGRARWLLVRDIGYVVEARERALNADRTDAQERRVLDSLVASVGGGTTKAGRAKLRRLLAGLVPKNGRSGGGSNGGGSRPGSGSNGGGSRPGSGSNPGSVGKGVGAKALAIARKEVGVKETSDNYSKRIHVYQKTTGAYRQAWCASFVNWAFRRAGKTVPGGGLAAVRTWVDLARQKKSGLKLVSAANARPGDLVAYDWGGGTDFGGDAHIGILASTPKGGRWTSLDGNTSADKVELKHRSSSMGNTVFIRVA